MSIGETLVILRKKKSWTQERLSQESGISHQAISNIETGRNAPSEASLRLLASALNVSVDELLGKEPPVRREAFSLSDMEKDLLYLFRQLNEAGKSFLMSQAENILLQPAFRKDGSMSSMG